MEITKERYNEIGYIAFREQIFGDMTLRRLAKIDENDAKKRIGYLAQETGLPKDELLEFIKRFVNDEIYLMVKKINDIVQQTSFHK